MTNNVIPHWENSKQQFKWPVAVTGPIETSAQQVWDTISMPGNLELCHPFCDKNPVKVWPGPESQDEVHYLSGLVFERRFQRWIDGVGYDLEIGRHEGPSSFVSWRISPTNDHSCVLRIAVYPYVLQNLPVAIRWLPHVLRLRPMLKSYLTSVIKGFDWYITRGEPVPRNQFGPHPWFSGPSSFTSKP